MEITFVINSNAVQASLKRRCRSKVRTGCATCKARRVKCDEKKPQCTKCVSTGRACPGYDVFRSVHAKVLRPPTLRANPAPLLPNATARERFYFDKFQSSIVDGFCGIYDGSWWSPYVLKTAVAEPMILHAALAFSSAKVITESDGEAFALKQYSKAMTCLQEGLAQANDMNPNVLLLSCLLLACLGFARNNHEEATLHLNGGSAILSRIKDTTSQPEYGDSTEGAECCIINAFRRLDLGNTLSMSTGHFPTWFAKWIEKKRIVLDPPQLHNLALLRNRLDRWTTEVICLMQDNQSLRNPDTPPYRNIIPLQVRLEEMRAASDQWLYGFKHMVTHTIPAITSPTARKQAERAANILRIHHCSSSLLLATTFGNGRESVFDNHLDDFKTIVELSAPLVPHFQSMSSGFTLDIGIVPTLYYTVTKCRDPETRHQALALLSSLSHREGSWDAQASARDAKKILEMEERATAALCPGVATTDASHIPEMARLHHPYFDFKTGEHFFKTKERVIYCRRRRFESDGEWVYWEESVD